MVLEEYTLALDDCNKALELAQMQENVREKQKKEKQKKEKADAAAKAKLDATNTNAAGADGSTAAAPATLKRKQKFDDDEYLVDPFLSLPPVSFASLFYQRGLVHEGLKSISAANEDFEQATKLSPDLSFIVGQHAQQTFKARNNKGDGLRSRTAAAAATAQ